MDGKNVVLASVRPLDDMSRFCGSMERETGEKRGRWWVVQTLYIRNLDRDSPYTRERDTQRERGDGDDVCTKN